MEKIENQSDRLSGDTPMEFDVFSQDGQMVGRVAGYVNEVREDQRSFEHDSREIITAPGETARERRLLIDGRGLPIQGEIAVPESKVEIDMRGRRVTLRVTMEQLRNIPRYDSDIRDSQDLSAANTLLSENREQGNNAFGTDTRASQP